MIFRPQKLPYSQFHRNGYRHFLEIFHSELDLENVSRFLINIYKILRNAHSEPNLYHGSILFSKSINSKFRLVFKIVFNSLPVGVGVAQFVAEGRVLGVTVQSDHTETGIE